MFTPPKFLLLHSSSERQERRPLIVYPKELWPTFATTPPLPNKENSLIYERLFLGHSRYHGGEGFLVAWTDDLSFIEALIIRYAPTVNKEGSEDLDCWHRMKLHVRRSLKFLLRWRCRQATDKLQISEESLFGAHSWLTPATSIVVLARMGQWSASKVADNFGSVIHGANSGHTRLGASLFNDGLALNVTGILDVLALDFEIASM